MNDFLQKMKQAYSAQLASQNGLGRLTPASIDSIVNIICTHIENDILRQANGKGMTHTQLEGNFISHQYEYRFYHAKIPVEFRDAPCSALYHHFGGESDYDNEKYVVGVRNLTEAKQIATAIIRRLYANKLQVHKSSKKHGRLFYMEFFTAEEIIQLIQKSTTLKLGGFSTEVYYIVSKTQKQR